MTQTESRTGFRLPWTSDDKIVERRTNEQAAAAEPNAEQPTVDATVEAVDADATGASDTMIGSTEAVETDEAGIPSPEPFTERSAPDEDGASVPPTAAAAPSTPAVAAPRKSTKFMADLTKAMQAAAEAARTSTLEQFGAEAKTYIEQIHTRSSEECTGLRRQADDDIVGIREWSKAEVARIREETEARISGRKSDLDLQLEAHAARIERAIERIQGRVSGYEADMARFFERLLQEDDPAEFAALAERLPEPPPFDDGADLAPEAPVAAVAEPEPFVDVRAAAEAAMVAIEAAHQAAAEAEAVTEADTAALPEAEPDSESDPSGDPRLAALGLTAAFDAAEADAAAFAASSSEDDIPTMDDDALAARLEGLVPTIEAATSNGRAQAQASTASSSQVVVTGLVSVASIASFKRHLGRIAGVQSVGVSSGPDGEFVFTVAHGDEVSLGDVVPTLPGFEARVIATGEGIFNVAARDPESEA